MTTDSDVTRQRIESAAIQAFSFLQPDGPADRRETGTTTTLRFVSAPLFVETELDWREEAAFVLLGLLDHSRVPDGYYLDSDGRHVRWHLGVVLEQNRMRARAARLRSVTRLSGESAMVQQLSESASIIRDVQSELPALVTNMRA